MEKFIEKTLSKEEIVEGCVLQVMAYTKSAFKNDEKKDEMSFKEWFIFCAGYLGAFRTIGLNEEDLLAFLPDLYAALKKKFDDIADDVKGVA